MISDDVARTIAMALPGAEERASYGGRPSWRTPQRMFTWIREDPEALVVWVESEEDKFGLVDAEPEKFFTTDHYDGHAIVLVNRDAVDATEAEELITESWRLRATKTAVRKFDESHRPPL